MGCCHWQLVGGSRVLGLSLGFRWDLAREVRCHGVGMIEERSDGLIFCLRFIRRSGVFKVVLMFCRRPFEVEGRRFHARVGVIIVSNAIQDFS